MYSKKNLNFNWSKFSLRLIQENLLVSNWVYINDLLTIKTTAKVLDFFSKRS